MIAWKDIAGRAQRRREEFYKAWESGEPMSVEKGFAAKVLRNISMGPEYAIRRLTHELQHYDRMKGPREGRRRKRDRE